MLVLQTNTTINKYKQQTTTKKKKITYKCKKISKPFLTIYIKVINQQQMISYVGKINKKTS